MNTAAIILAAGFSRRFGSSKQNLTIAGETLIDRSYRIATEAGCQPIYLVVNHLHDAKNDYTKLVNPDSNDGMGSSLALAAKKLIEFHPNTEKALIILPDQPAITAKHLIKLSVLCSSPEKSISIAKHHNIHGPPACFHHKHFPELTKLSGDHGGKSIIQKNKSSVSKVHIPEAHWDIDTPKVWKEYLQSIKSS